MLLISVLSWLKWVSMLLISFGKVLSLVSLVCIRIVLLVCCCFSLLVRFCVVLVEWW